MQYCHLHKGINTVDDAATSCKNLVNFGSVTPDVYLCGIVQKLVYDLHSSRWHFQTCSTIEMSMGVFKEAMDLYISYKFGWLLSSNSAVNAAQVCTAGIKQHSG